MRFIAGIVITLLSCATLLMSILKYLRVTFFDTKLKLLQSLAVCIDDLHSNYISPYETLSHWWRLAPEPDPANLSSMQTLYICLILGAFALGIFLCRSGPIKIPRFIFTHASGFVPRHAVLGVGVSTEVRARLRPRVM